ncbi:MAG: M48 family metallopeptidase [Verrucomicrobia bacterium]|nr:M48 family metallopeptidase [Verrucomicrobiota bacterium]
MDFFEAQAHAKKRTSRLTWLFALAVVGTVAATYFAAVLALNFVNRDDSPRYHRENRNGTIVRVRDAESPGLRLWQPRVYVWTTLGTLAVIGLASLYKWREYSAGGAAVAESVGGRRVDPRTTDTLERRLLNVVEEMAIASGIPVPAVYVLDDENAINAFAAGLTTNDAVVAVTRGTMEKLSRDELQGVVGHEFSHILNGDMRLNLRIGAIVFGILVIGLAGRGLLWSMRNVRVSSRDSKGSGGLVIGMFLVGLALLIIGYVGYFFGRLIQAAVSRQREFLADASAVQFTRNPGGIAGALKKIGGYALGSSLQTSKAAEIGHFFFAQGFTSSLASLFATHPPLDERIRAIEPSFDGQMFEPPEVVDIEKESFQTAGFQRGPRYTPDETAQRAFAAPAAVPPPRLATRIPYQPAAAVARIGALADEHFQRAQQLLAAIPAGLRDATRDPALAPAIVYGLLLDGPPDVREKQRSLIEKIAGPGTAAALDRLGPALSLVDPAARLPLLQLCTPALRTLDAASPEPAERGALDRFVTTLDELVHADGSVSTFEFSLQKTLQRSLDLSRAPGAGATQLHSFHAVVREISVVLSALAHTSSADTDEAARARPELAERAFAAGAAQLKLIEQRLYLLAPEDSTLAQLDAALDRLATASLPIKQRLLTAAAHVIGADGTILVEEAELLRAISATLDCPMAPMSTAA